MKKLVGLGLLLLALLPLGVVAAEAASCPYMSGATECPYMSSAECAPVCSPELMQACQVQPGTQDAPVCQIDGQFCTADMMASCPVMTSTGVTSESPFCTVFAPAMAFLQFPA